jgi:hypothetical protein
VHADEKLTAFLELEAAIRACGPLAPAIWHHQSPSRPETGVAQRKWRAPRIKRQLAERRKRGCADYPLRTSSA